MKLYLSREHPLRLAWTILSGKACFNFGSTIGSNPLKNSTDGNARKQLAAKMAQLMIIIVTYPNGT